MVGTSHAGPSGRPGHLAHQMWIKYPFRKFLGSVLKNEDFYFEGVWGIYFESPLRPKWTGQFDWHVLSGEWGWEVSADRHSQMSSQFKWQIYIHLTSCDLVKVWLTCVQAAVCWWIMSAGRQRVILIHLNGENDQTHTFLNFHCFHIALVTVFILTWKKVQRPWPTNLVFTCLSYLLPLLRH